MERRDVLTGAGYQSVPLFANCQSAPGGRSALQLKDVRLICELAESVGFQSPTLDNCRPQWERFVQEEGHGDLDHSGLFLLYGER
jgi:3-hydroxyisobutyrate dehydrogenase-like beta-hydroxyacid dehydrogenase